MEKKKVLFIVHHRRDRSPGQRFRFEQYTDFLEQNGYQCDFSVLLPTPEEDKAFYSPSIMAKGSIFLKALRRRMRDAARAKQYDIIFVYREAFMTGTTYFEKQFKKGGAKMVLDYDDSIWMSPTSESNKLLAFLKDSDKTSKLIAMSDMIFAGNEYLADYGRKFNSNVRIVPTTIDTEEYKPLTRKPNDRVCIGWSGSFSTIVHFQHAIEPLKKILEKYGDKVYVKVIGDGNYRNPELGITGLPWKKDTELEDLSEIDIGIMPLPDDEWTKGKCGLKGLQYMALGIPTIMSPVGVNTDIIRDGDNGFLAGPVNEWVDKLSLLIESPERREKMGAAGRKTVEDDFSIHAVKHLYLQLFNELTGRSN